MVARSAGSPVDPNSNVPDRGDVVWARLSPTEGHEQAGHRPAVVLSPAAYNAATGLALTCPVTSKVKGYPFEVALPSDLEVAGVVLADQVRSIDWRSGAVEFAATLPRSVVAEVVAKVKTLLS